MKVGTDGVLLGAIAEAGDSVRRILDIGTGTGLVAVMLAQRFEEAHVDGLDIDHEAVEQARENSAASPYGERIEIIEGDVKAYESAERYDLIVSNPPYFAGDLECPDGRRNMARHTVGLSHGELMEAMARLLTAEGRACVIVPAEARQKVEFEAEKRGLSSVRTTTIYSVERKPAKRVICQFAGAGARVEHVEERLVLLDEDGRMSHAYAELTSDFYLDRS